jgi:hypothetical protein
MRLLSLKVEARGIKGWESPTLDFGKRITFLFAKNGSGKTPLIQALSYCLGYPVTFRQDINDHCEAFVLTVQIDAETLTFRRVLANDFQATITYGGGDTKEFSNEAEFAEVVSDLVGLSLPKLVSTNRQATQPYMSTLLPLFYREQSDGYSDVYSPPKSFISDQFVEMARFVFGLSPKNSFLAKSDLLKAKEDLDSVDRRLVRQQQILSDQGSEMDERPNIETILEQRAAEISEQLAAAKDSAGSEASTNGALENLILQKRQEQYRLNQEVATLSERVNGISSIKGEIETEIDTLSLNEEARSVFDSFNEICANPSCGLFMGSQETYAKNLLYLRDQIKDLERNASLARIRIDEIKSHVAAIGGEVQLLTKELSAQVKSNGVRQLIAVVQDLTKELLQVERQRSNLKFFRIEQGKYISLANDRERVLDRIANLSSDRRSDLEFNKFRNRLRELTIKWLDILETKNVSRDLDIDLELRFKFGGEKLVAFSGSTKIRIVLAIHAALFELYLDLPTRGFRFIVLDTPKQQEMHTGDLAKFLEQLALICRKLNAQLIFSSTEFRFPIEADDIEWTPSYSGPEQLMYLGSFREMSLAQ